MSRDPFANDSNIERRAHSKGDGFWLRGFHLIGIIFGLALTTAVAIPIVMLSIDAFTTRKAPPADVPGAIENAHSLGINPKDGQLYVATPRGLYRVLGVDSAERIAESYQENSGFIVLGPDEFLASGRPDIRDLISGFEPQHSGLIRSDNAGHSWKTIALKGQARFTTIEAWRDLLFAYEEAGQAFMTSADGGRSWQALSTQPLFLDLAVNPADRSLMLAATEGPTLRTRDGGESWQPLPQPRFLFAGWEPGGRLWGVDEPGAIYASNDSGATWSQEGSLPVGLPQAFLAADSGLYAAVKDVGIFRSTDGAKTWEMVYREPDPSER